ncbi:MAG TPA: four helix bundle protein [Bacteroidales bacterium]|nr:four helix bundle protein [Bacteroidales bacterium]
MIEDLLCQTGLNMMQSFKELEVWKQCRKLRNETRVLVINFPVEEKHRLSDQMIRASRSATNQIAEGYGRFHFQENVQFCRIARGSLFEYIDHLSVASDSGYISEEVQCELENLTTSCIRLLNGYINYLLKVKGEYNQGKVNEESEEYRNDITSHC